MSYVIEIKRRARSDIGYEGEPWVAAAVDGDRLVAVQFGRTESDALSRCWRIIREDHEARHPLRATVEIA